MPIQPKIRPVVLPKSFQRKETRNLRKSMVHIGKTRGEETTTETSKEIKMEGRRGHGRRAGTQLT